MECTVSKATILGADGSTSDNNLSRSSGSLCLNTCFGTPGGEICLDFILDFCKIEFKIFYFCAHNFFEVFVLYLIFVSCLFVFCNFVKIKIKHFWSNCFLHFLNKITPINTRSPEFLIPWIMEAWFKLSLKIWHPLKSRKVEEVKKLLKNVLKATQTFIITQNKHSNSPPNQSTPFFLKTLVSSKPPLPPWLTRHHLSQGEEGGIISDVARGEQKGCFLLVHIRQHLFQFFVVGWVAWNVSRAPSPHPMLVDCFAVVVVEGGFGLEF